MGCLGVSYIVIISSPSLHCFELPCLEKRLNGSKQKAEELKNLSSGYWVRKDLLSVSFYFLFSFFYKLIFFRLFFLALNSLIKGVETGLILENLGAVNSQPEKTRNLKT